MNSKSVSDTYPLSPMQRGMLFHSLDARRPGVDIEQVTVVLPEALEPQAFEQTWRRAMERHSILRTAFRWEGLDQPLQDVRTDTQLDFTWHDWRHLDPDEREQRWEKLLAGDRQRGFRLDVAPLWRLAVVQTGAREHRLIITLHHILIDARGLVTLLNETLAVPKARDQVSKPVASYRDYIDRLQHQDLREAEIFWRRALKGFTQPTPLPGAGEPAGEPTRDFPPHREHKIVIPAPRTRTLRELARRHGFTLNTLVLGAWALLLGRHSGKDDVAFGLVRACRHTTVESEESIVGPLINTLPLRVELPPDQPVLEWLQRLRETWNAIRPHENTPLTEIHAWGDMPRGLPLFESLVSFQEPAWDASLKAQGGVWRKRRFSNRSHPSYPLALDATGGATLALKILYDPLRFTDDTVQRMFGHLSTLLRAIASNPQTPLARLPMLTPEEQRQLLVEWNATQAEYPDDLCLHHLFEAQSARNFGSLAVADERRSLTYGQLNAHSRTLARELHTRNVGPDVCVAICLPRSVDFVVAALAVLKAGGAYVPIDPAYPPERLTFMVTNSQSAVLLTHRRFAHHFVGTRARVICLDGPHDPPSLSDSRSPIPATPTPRHLAYVIYTSGSTGVPKGVSIRHCSVLNLVAWHQRTYQVTSADRATQLASPAFDASVWELWPYLTAGASIHIPPEEVRNDPAQLVIWLATRRITLTFLSTPLAEAVLDQNWPRDIALRAILTGGDRLRRWPGDRLPCPLVNHYGPTEATVVATRARVPPAPDMSALPSIGMPIANTEIHVLDRHRQLMPIGAAGELYVGGVGLARGYHGQPELTAEKFVPHPFRSGARLYRTGDLARRRSDGCLEFLGRLDRQIKIRGHRIEPAEIETALNTHPSVSESLVLLLENAGQPQLVAYFVPPAERDAPAAEELAGLLRARVPDTMVPSAFVALDSWPLTVNGKVDRGRLPAPERPGAALPEFVAPHGRVEETVTRVWTEVLGRPAVGAHENFFELGGHSLIAAQVISRLNAAFGVSLSVHILFENPTVAGIAREIEREAARGGSRPVSAIARVRRRPVTGSPSHRVQVAGHG